jgi:MerR family transcriptional regulator, light-induced transcriptional regulator
MMPKDILNQFLEILDQENKQEAVRFATELLEKGTLSIEELYIQLLAPSLLFFSCKVEDEEICIWKEHFRTSIIRTILEISYTFILKRLNQIPKVNKKVVILTPAFEYHEIGAIMNAHFMLLEGFDANYIGANTPKNEILSAIRAYEPDFIAISVTNPYNLVITKQITDEIRRFFPNVGIILGGQAFREKHNVESIKYDYILQSLDDLKAFRKQVSA